jgi:hypothetical protein
MMNILINAVNAIDPILMEELVNLPETSIYLSLSLKDTMRILNETHPEVLITDRKLTSTPFLDQVTALFPELEIYLYDKAGTEPGDCALIRHPKPKLATLSEKWAGFRASSPRQCQTLENFGPKLGIQQTNLQSKRRPK